MSHRSESAKTKLHLWVAAGGRCEYLGCPKLLYRDDLTLREMNRANIAHIVADKATGPRGNKALSRKLRNEFGNLMLLCYDHHHLIDHEGLDEHPVEVLRSMKAEHERRIEAVTNIDHERKTDVFTYTAKIDNFIPRITAPETAIAVLANGMYPALPYPQELGRGNSLPTDADDRFWQEEEKHLRAIIHERLLPQYERGHLKDLSIFAIGPQPLLILLGHLLRDISKASVYQRHREPPGWIWQNRPGEFEYIVEEPDGAMGEPVLVLALSASVKDDRVFEKVGDDAAIWRITIHEPNNDFLKSQQQLQQFRDLIRPLLDTIKDRYDRGTVLNVFPSAPVSVCVELGRAIQPKAHMPMRLWDENKDLGGFVSALNINTPERGDL